MEWFHWPDLTVYSIYQDDFTGDRMAVGDIDGDGAVDAVSGKNIDETIDVFWYKNPFPAVKLETAQVWKEHRIGNFGDHIKDILVVDLNADGYMDVVARSHDMSKIFFQQSDSWVEKTLQHPYKEGMAVGDLDDDGDVDIVMNGFWFETPEEPQTGEYVFHNIDSTWYTQETGTWQDNCCYVGVSDLNADGISDIVLGHSEKAGYPLNWYTVEAKEHIKSGPWIAHPIAERFDWCETVDIGDVDLDGTLDVMAAKFRRHDPENYDNEPPYPVTIFYNPRGDALMWTEQDLDSLGIYAGVMGDVGGDGDLDVLGPQSYYTGPIRLWENQIK